MADKTWRVLHLTLGVLMLLGGLGVLYLRSIGGEFLSVITALYALVAAVGAFWLARWWRAPSPPPPRLPPAVLAERSKRRRVSIVVVILAIFAVTGWNIAMVPGAWMALLAFTGLVVSLMVLAFRWGERRFEGL